MPTYNSRGFPLYSDAETNPGWDAAFNSQSNLLATAMDTSEAAAKAAWSVDTIAEIPDPGDSTRGQILYCAEDELIYVFDGTSWYAVAGKAPYFFGTRALSAVSNLTDTFYVTTNAYARGATFSAGVITLETVGIYRLDQEVIWEANSFGQRNLGVQGTDITFLGQAISFLSPPSATLPVSQAMSTYILATAPGATVKPYVAHNAGVSLDVSGAASVMWVSA